MQGTGVNRLRRIVVLAGCGAALAIPATATAIEPGVDRDFTVIEKLRSDGHKNGVTTIRNDLYRAGKKIGSDRLRCRTGKVTRCDFLFRLPKGNITGAGDVGPGSGAIRLTGGTGAYAGARGSAQGQKLRRHTVKVTFHIDK